MVPFQGASERIGADAGRRLGQAVGFGDVVPGHLLPALGHRLLHRRAAADHHLHRGKIELVESGRVQEAVEQRIDAGHDAPLPPPELLDERRQVARVGDEHDQAAPLHERQRRGQAEDVVQRQRRDDDFRAFLEAARDPHAGLLQVGEDVAVGEHRALRDAGGAAGVLQERDVVARHVDRLERRRRAARERRAEA